MDTRTVRTVCCKPEVFLRGLAAYYWSDAKDCLLYFYLKSDPSANKFTTYPAFGKLKLQPKTHTWNTSALFPPLMQRWEREKEQIKPAMNVPFSAAINLDLSSSVPIQCDQNCSIYLRFPQARLLNAHS